MPCWYDAVKVEALAGGSATADGTHGGERLDRTARLRRRPGRDAGHGRLVDFTSEKIGPERSLLPNLEFFV